MMHPLRFCLALLAAFLLLAGCQSESTSTSKTAGSKKDSSSEPEATSEVARSEVKYYPDVPQIAVMQDVDGIEIPRVNTKESTLDLNAKIPVDEFNPAAKGKPTKPARGGRIVMRIPSEPKSMNPITETSAVQSIMSADLVNQTLATQDLETFEFKPMMAPRWVVEDSVKLAADYPKYERYVAEQGKPPAMEIQVTYPEYDAKEEPPTVELTTYGPDKKTLGKVWVNLSPIAKIVGVPEGGYHLWSDSNGRVPVRGLKPGEYTVHAGHEIIGVADVEGDGGLRVRPESPQNPLKKMLGESEYLDLSKDDFSNIERGTVFTYFIDPRIKWSDGVPFTAKDLVFTHKVINNPLVDGESIRSYYADVIRCDAIDDHTIRMQYRKQYFLALEFTAGLPLYAPPWHVFEKKYRDKGKTLTLEPLTEAEEAAQNKISVSGGTFAKDFNTDESYGHKPLGTGPYVISEWIDHDKLVLRRNPNYWSDEFDGYLDEIVFKFIIEDTTAIDALRAGEIDFLYHISADKFHEDLKGPPDWMKGRYVKASWYIPSFSYIGWNLNRELFKDRRVRIALALLLDMEEFREKKHRGDSVLVSGSQYYFSPSYDHSVKPIGFDLETARDLLSDAGWADTDGDGVLDRNGRKFEFTFLVSTGSETAKYLGALLQENCKKVGIKLNIDRLEWASFLEKVMNKDFDAVTLAWLSSPESDPYQIWHSSGAGPKARSSNHVSFNNPLADELIEKLRVTLDKDKRIAIYHSFHRLLDSEQPYRFLYTPKDFGAYNQKFRGIKWYRLRPGYSLLEWYIPQELQ